MEFQTKTVCLYCEEEMWCEHLLLFSGMSPIRISTLAKELPLVARTQINSQECIHSSSR